MSKESSAATPVTFEETTLQTKFKVIGELFTPAIPGIIAAGLCAGFAALMAQLIPEYRESLVWNSIYQLLNLINVSFMTYMTAWIGYCACRRFGGTPILGGMLGMITCLDGINAFSQTLGLYNEAKPLNSVLCTGRGGVLAAIIGAWVIAKVEKRIHDRMSDALDMVVTPFLSILFTAVPYILIIMPATGYISTWLCNVLELICLSSSIWVRVISGYICAALFLPVVMMGMSYGFDALYSMQLESQGYVTLFPTLAMAGAGQVGAGLALLLMARKIRNRKFSAVISASIIPGMMGIGNPLLFGVTLPLGKPLITACIGGGFGGAFVMAMEVASTSWGPSGLLALPLMTAGPYGAIKTIILYFLGLSISCIMGFLITLCFVKPDSLKVM